MATTRRGLNKWFLGPRTAQDVVVWDTVVFSSLLATVSHTNSNNTMDTSEVDFNENY